MISDALDFFAPCIPPKTTSQMKRAVRTANGIRFFKSKDQEAAEVTIHSVLIPHRPERPLVNAVALTVDVTWPWRKSDLATKAKRDAAQLNGRMPFGSKPDADNLVKAIQDALVALRFIERDELVVDLHVRKWVGFEPGIRIQIQKVATW